MATRKKSLRSYRWPALALAVVVITMGILELTNVTHLFHSEKPKPIAITGGALTKDASSSAAQQSTSTQPTSTSSQEPSSNTATKNPGTSSTSTTSALIAPWGTFSNNNTAALGEDVGSTCNTTSGATCQIIFTNGSLTKSLDARNTDAGGAVYWVWKPRDYGLTPGTWHLTMKAVLGSQTKTTSNDPLTLEITQ